MNSLSVARLMCACVLSACCCPTPPVVVVPPTASTAASPPKRGIIPDSEPGISRRGNCRQETGSSGGIPYALCSYTFDNAVCSTDFINCRRITGPCVVGSTEDPPSSCG